MNTLGHTNHTQDHDELRRLMMSLLPNLEGTPGRLTAIEVGSWVGSTALTICNSTCYLETLFCIDHWIGSPRGDLFDDRLGQISRHLGKEQVFKTFCENLKEHLFKRCIPLTGTSLQYAAVWPFPVSFIFIDASHDYQSAKEDIAAWWPHLCPGGIMAVHDYQTQFPGVCQAFDEVLGVPDMVGGFSLAHKVKR